MKTSKGIATVAITTPQVAIANFSETIAGWDFSVLWLEIAFKYIGSI